MPPVPKSEPIIEKVKRHIQRRQKPKGVTAKRRASKRAKQLRADRRVYAHVDARDGLKSRISGKGGAIHRHHIVFRSRGGKTTPENVITVTDEEHAAIHKHFITLRGNADVIGGVECLDFRVPDQPVHVWI